MFESDVDGAAMEQVASSQTTGKVCLFLDLSLETLQVKLVHCVCVCFFCDSGELCYKKLQDRFSLMRLHHDIQGQWSSG